MDCISFDCKELRPEARKRQMKSNFNATPHQEVELRPRQSGDVEVRKVERPLEISPPTANFFPKLLAILRHFPVQAQPKRSQTDPNPPLRVSSVTLSYISLLLILQEIICCDDFSTCSFQGHGYGRTLRFPTRAKRANI